MRSCLLLLAVMGYCDAAAVVGRVPTERWLVPRRTFTKLLVSTDTVTETAASSCYHVTPDLPPCGERGARDIAPTATLPAIATSSISSEMDEERISDLLSSSSDTTWELLGTRHQNPVQIDGAVKGHLYNIDNKEGWGFLGFNIDTTVTRVVHIHQTKRILDPSNVVTLMISGCQPSVLPFNVPLCEEDILPSTSVFSSDELINEKISNTEAVTMATEPLPQRQQQDVHTQASDMQQEINTEIPAAKFTEMHDAVEAEVEITDDSKSANIGLKSEEMIAQVKPDFSPSNPVKDEVIEVVSTQELTQDTVQNEPQNKAVSSHVTAVTDLPVQQHDAEEQVVKQKMPDDKMVEKETITAVKQEMPDDKMMEKDTITAVKQEMPDVKIMEKVAITDVKQEMQDDKMMEKVAITAVKQEMPDDKMMEKETITAVKQEMPDDKMMEKETGVKSLESAKEKSEINERIVETGVTERDVKDADSVTGVNKSVETSEMSEPMDKVEEVVSATEKMMDTEMTAVTEQLESVNTAESMDEKVGHVISMGEDSMKQLESLQPVFEASGTSDEGAPSVAPSLVATDTLQPDSS